MQGKHKCQLCAEIGGICDGVGIRQDHETRKISYYYCLSSGAILERLTVEKKTHKRGLCDGDDNGV